MQQITPDLIRAALAHIPATLARDEWARVAMAIKSEFSDSTGRDLFTDWSATADNFDAKATRSTWQSIKAGGGVGIGTLLHLAKEHGFTLPKTDQAPAAPSPEALAQRERERAANQQREQARTEAAHAQAAGEAAARWQEASDTGESAYLARKGVQAHGVRFALDGRVLVPVRDATGKLWNLQHIAPAKPTDGGTDKLFLKGGRKSGLWHMVGELGSTDDAVAGPAVVLVAEGYATAASLHQATGRPAAVAFDVGNLAHVAKALRTLYPAALLVLCGDDDRDTEARTGTNPGRTKATAAARSVKGLAVFPEPLPEGGSDFNDLHQAAGLDAVRACIEAAIQAHQAQQTAAQAAPAGRAGKGRQSAPREASGASEGDHHDAQDTGRAFDPFTVLDDGVWHTGRDQDGNDKRPEWVCSRLDVEALTRDQDGGGWGYLLTFADPLGKVKTWAMPARMLSGDGGEYRAALLNSGLRIAPSPRARNLLTQFIQTRQPDAFASCTERTGWHGRAFVLPHETISDDEGERVIFQSESAMENTFRIKSTTEAWIDRVGIACVGNSRLVFGVSCAFAGPLLRPAGEGSGGFHIRGDSSCGKSTVQNVASSVYGSPSFKRSWRSTDNALESVAVQHNDCLLILDEISQIEARVIGDVAYMLGNGEGKARATRTATPRPRLTWRLLFLSTGEKKLSDIMAEAQRRTNAGQDVRMAEIPADAGAGMGAFENLHGHEGGAAFSNYLTGQAASVYGAPGRAWLEWLTTNADTLKARIREASAALGAQLVPEAASGQVERVGARFALVGAAGELATEAGLTGWPKGESERAARACFNAWLAARGGIGNGEVVAMLRAVRRFLEAHGDGRFAMWHRSADDHAPKTLQRAGVRRMLNANGQPIKSDPEHQREYGERMPAALGEGVSFEYFILAETFKGEVCQGFDHQAVARVLLEHGCLVTKEPGRFSIKTKLPGIGSARCYRIPPAIFELDL